MLKSNAVRGRKSLLQIFLFKESLPGGKEPMFKGNKDLRGYFPDSRVRCDMAQLSRVLLGRLPGSAIKDQIRQAVVNKLSHQPNGVQESWIKRADDLLFTDKGSLIPGNRPISKVHLEVVSKQKNPTQDMFELLDNLELEAGFSFRKETCLFILKDFIQHKMEV